jgi:hypothetical protein
MTPEQLAEAKASTQVEAEKSGIECDATLLLAEIVGPQGSPGRAKTRCSQAASPPLAAAWLETAQIDPHELMRPERP